MQAFEEFIYDTESVFPRHICIVTSAALKIILNFNCDCLSCHSFRKITFSIVFLIEKKRLITFNYENLYIGLNENYTVDLIIRFHYFTKKIYKY